MAVLRTGFTVLIAVLLQVQFAGAQAAFEYELKAAFLYRLTEFVDWPADAFPSGNAPFRICVFGADPFGDSLDRVLRGERVKGHPLAAARVTQVEQLAGCHIVFIGSSQRERITAVLNSLRASPVLTVADMDNFLEQGGTMNFVTAGGRLSFDINITAADRARLQFSSKLLRLARTIRKG